MIEDYYGFSAHRENTVGFGRQRSTQRTERSPKMGSRILKSPGHRALKRTELSKEKLKSKETKREIPLRVPQMYRSDTNRQDYSSNANQYQGSYEQSASNRQQLEMMVKKYDNYMMADSIEITNRDISKDVASNYTHDLKFRPQSRPRRAEEQYAPRYNHFERGPSEQQYAPRYYHSASRGKNTEFLSNFQRAQPMGPVGNAIDRANQNITSRSQTPRGKKSKSLTHSIKKRYIMHTFYHAERANFCNYNGDGYVTERQQQLLIRIEEKARRAFERAAYDYQTEKRDSSNNKKSTRIRKFQVQDSSRLQHKNSAILDDLKLNENSRFNSIPIATKRNQSNRIQHRNTSERVVDVSISPSKGDSHYDDYQLNKQGSKNIHEIPSNPSISHFLDDKRATDEYKKVGDAENDDSLLEFKPYKKKVEEKQPSKHIEEKQPSKQNIKKGSELSEYKSVDMMEINSNCKFNHNEEKDDKEKSEKQKEKVDYNSQDNRSLGINTIKSFNANKKKNSQSHQSSLSRSESQSSSQSQSRSDTISQVESRSQKPARNSNKLSRSGSNLQKSHLSQHNFSKNKVKASHSLSDMVSQSIKIEITLPPQQKKEEGQKGGSSMSQKQQEFQQIAQKEPKEQSSIKDTSQKKIKRLKNTGQNHVEAPQQSEGNLKIDSNEGNLKIDSNQKIQSLSALGMQSFPQYEKIEALQMKINPVASNAQNKPMSRISEAANSHFNSKIHEGESSPKSKNRHSLNSSMHPSQNSVGHRSKVRSSKNIGSISNMEYDLFTEVRQFIEDEQYDYNQVRKQKEVPQLISQQLGEHLNKIEQHLYLLNCIAELIIIIPDVYDFQTIYNKQNQWIFLPIFLTLKKYIYERERVAIALAGGKNCFNLLGLIIEDEMLSKYSHRVEVKNILDNLLQCNSKLNTIMGNFYHFLINFKKLSTTEPYFNLKQFNNQEQLFVLLSEFDKQIDTLKKKREEEFNNVQLDNGDEEQYEMLMIVNERIFRLMEIGFVLSNLAGKEIKAYEKDQQLYRDQQAFKDYIFENQQLFKQMIRYFK